MAVIVDRDIALRQQMVDLFDAVAAPVQARPTRVHDRIIALDHHGVIGFQILCGNVLEQRPPRMAIHAVADGPAGNAAVQNFHQLKIAPVLVRAGIEEMRAGAIAGRRRHVGGIVAQGAAQYIELPGQGMGAAAQRGREIRLYQGALGQGDVDQVIKAVVEQDLRIEHHDHVDANEHLEHAVVEVEIDRSRRLGRRAGPIEKCMLPFAPDGQLHLEGAIAQAVIVHIILERLWFGGQVLHDQLPHGPFGAFQQGLAGLRIDVRAEAFAEFNNAFFTRPAAGDDGHQVGKIHFRRAGIVHDQVKGGLVQGPALV